ncbi:MAG: hypothetical protein QXN62_08755 [Candidatus Bathyarchaeia archaeon]
MELRNGCEKLCAVIVYRFPHSKHMEGVKLIEMTLPQAGTPYVKMVAVIAKFKPFAEKAGITKIAESKPDLMLIKVAKTPSILQQHRPHDPLRILIQEVWKNSAFHGLLYGLQHLP